MRERYLIYVDCKLEASITSLQTSKHLVEWLYKKDQDGRYPRVELVQGSTSIVRYAAMTPKEEHCEH